jgi:hypothetical protein
MKIQMPTLVFLANMILHPPKNVRDVVAKSCANCAYFYEYDIKIHGMKDIAYACKRTEIDDHPSWGDCIPIQVTVCDGHKHAKIKLQ